MSGFRESYTPVPLKDTNLFKPLKVGNMTRDHRVVVPPLTRRRTNNGVPTDLLREWYHSSKKASFIITEGTFITEAAGGYEVAPLVTRNKLKVGSPSSRPFMITNLIPLGTGRQSFPAVLSKNTYKFVSATVDCYMDEASKEAAIKFDTPLKGLTETEIKQYVKDYVRAAKKAIEAGADGVELHNANGYST